MRGAIEMSAVDESVRGLDVWLEWRTTSTEPSSGRTDVVRVSLEGRTLGGRARPTFSAKLPRAPLSYEGTLFSIEWYLVVSADVAWAKDPRVEKRLEVSPSEHSRPTKPRDEALDEITRSSVKLGAAAVAFRVAGSGFAASIIGATVGTAGGIAVALVGGGTLAASWAFHRRQRAQLFGAPSVVLDPGTPELGEPFMLRVVTSPKVPLLHTDITWQLVATEVLTTGSGKSRRVQRHVVYDRSGDVGQITRTAATRDGIAQTTITLPDATYASFSADRHELEWKLFVTLEAHPALGKPVSVTHALDIDVRR